MLEANEVNFPSTGFLERWLLSCRRRPPFLAEREALLETGFPALQPDAVFVLPC